ncbi:MAG TPA: PAS domain S-box protein [Acidimicrobiales bacterium]|nr:PAS domain S-box protein [Acidimicrobiales bacterium]
MPKLRHPSESDHSTSQPTGPTEASDVDLELLGLHSGVITLGEAMESLLDPMVILRPVRDDAGRVVDLEYVDANAAATQFLQTTLADLIGTRLETLAHIESSGLLAMYEQLADTGEPLVLDDFAYASTGPLSRLRYDIRATRIGDVLCCTWRDVTARNDLVDHFRLLAENASDVVFRTNAQFDVEWVSPSVFGLQGYRPEELVNRSLADLCHPDDVAAVATLIAESPRGQTGQTEIRVRGSDGTFRWVALIGRSIRDEHDGVLGYVGSLRDIDDEHARRQVQLETDRKFRVMAQYASDVVLLSHAGGGIEWVSDSITSLAGWAPEDLVGRRFAEFVHADDQTQLDSAREVVDQGEVARVTVRLRTSTGDYHWISVRARDVVDETTGERQRVASWRDAEYDVTSRIALERSEREFRLLAENASDVVVQLDADQVVQWVSPSVEQILGWAPHSLLGRTVSEFILTENPDDLGFSERNYNAVRVSRLRFRHADGRYLWMSARSRAFVNDSSRPSGRIVSLRDIEAEVVARETLIASESRFRLLAENATDIVIETDGGSSIRWVSPSLLRVLGWRPEEWLGHEPLEFIHPDDVQSVRDHRLAALRGDPTSALQVRFRDSVGAYQWMSGEDHMLRGRDNEVVTRIIGLRGIDDEVAALDSMAHAESQYRMLAENASDVVLQVNPAGEVMWVSPSVREVLGREANDMVGAPMLEFVAPEDHERVLALRVLLYGNSTVDAYEVRAVTASGDQKWTSVRPRAIHDDQGAVTSTVMSVRDIHAEVLARRALTTLSAGSRALIRANNEVRLLMEMCEIATGEGGYAFAWYVRKVYDERHSALKLVSSEKNKEYLDKIDVEWGDGPQGHGPAGRAMRLGETVAVTDLRDDERFAPWLEAALEHDLRTAVALPVFVDGQVDGALLVYASETGAFDDSAVSVLESLAAELSYGLSRLREQERLLQALNDHKLLSSAIEQAAETVLILDPSFSIIYANPSTVRTSGYSLDEIIGESPIIFGSGRFPQDHLDSMSQALSGGEAWRGVFINQRKNGEIYEEDATISPIHDAAGQLIAYVEVKTDVSKERHLESALSRSHSDRTSLIEVMYAVRSAATVHATAYLFTEAATLLSGIDLASVLLLLDDSTLLPISVSGTDIWDVNSERTIPLVPDLLGELDKGPVSVPTDPLFWPGNEQLALDLANEGIVEVAYAAIRWEGAVIGILGLGTKSAEVASQMATRYGYFEEIAAYAGTLIGAQARSFERRSVVRAHVLDVIANKSFQPFFQPMIDLKTNQIVGYEALTRFDDGTRPDEKILEAHSVGLGSELEAAVARAALCAALSFPPEVFISVNFSPETLLDGNAQQVVAEAGRPVVIEITEHAPVEDYAALRRAMSKLKGCELAVDDAGAGYTSLNHILELRPRYVKLDISLVRDVDTNPARQAMIAGMCHFAVQSDTILVAEGVESQSEADTLQRLGVALAEGSMLGQGFHFGRPAPVD